MKQGQQEAYGDPLTVEMFDGEVVITGPGRIGISLTPAAAAATAERLAHAAAAAEAWKPAVLAAQPVKDPSQDGPSAD